MKPRIYKSGPNWRCSHERLHSMGKTPVDAYRDYLRMLLQQAEMRRFLEESQKLSRGLYAAGFFK